MVVGFEPISVQVFLTSTKAGDVILHTVCAYMTSFLCRSAKLNCLCIGPHNMAQILD